MTDTDPQSPSPIDARLSVLASLLEPALTVARVLNVSLDDLQELVATGYFRMLQQRGISWQGMVRRLQKSRRTIASLAKRARGSEPMLSGSQRVSLRRHIVRFLAEGPADLDALLGRMRRVSPDELESELAFLVDEGIVQARDGDYQIAAELLDLIGPGFPERLDSLRHFLEAIAQVVYRRFLTIDREPEAFARVLTFSVSADEIVAIRERIYATVEKEVFEADARAEARADGAVQASVALCVVETPTDPTWRPRTG